MPSEAFIKAAAATNRQPVVLLAIESIDAIKKWVTIESDWAACALTNINTAVVEGEVRLTTDDAEPVADTYVQNITSGVLSNDAEIIDSYPGPGVDETTTVLHAETPIFCTRARTTGIKVWCSFFDSPIPSRTWALYGRRDGGAWELLDSVLHSFFATPYDTTLEVQGLTRGTWEFKVVIDEAVQRDSTRTLIEFYEVTHETHYLPTGSLTTAATAFDLGVIPVIPSRFEIDDTVPAGCTVTYTGWGRNLLTDAWTSLGEVNEYTPLDPYQYYQIKADFTSSADRMQTPIIREIRIIGGDSQYTYLSTHENIPIHGALPYIVPGGISSISSKIDLLQQATIGELTAKLYWLKKTGDMIAGDFLKNKTIICKLGFVGLSEVDYEPYFVGTWYDYQSDHEKGIITVKTRNILKRFNKKVPEVKEFMVYDLALGTWKVTDPAQTVELKGNVMRVMLEIIDMLGIPSRLVNTASFTALESGARSGDTPPVGLTPGSPWYVKRTLTEPQDAMEMLNELSVSSGVFLFEGADGRLTAKLYDAFAAADPVNIQGSPATLDAVHCKFRPVDGGQKDLFTRQAIYYNLADPSADGSSATDYKNVELKINAPAEIAWFGDLAEENIRGANTREWKDKWGISVVAIQMLATRWDSWFSVPRATVRVDDVPPRFYSIERGDVVLVDNLQLPCPEADWQGYTAGTRFLVMGKSISDPTTGNLTVSFDLMQLEVPEFNINPDFPNYSRLDYWPAVTALTVVPEIYTYNSGASTHVNAIVRWGVTSSVGRMAHEVQYRLVGGEWYPVLSPPGPELILPTLASGTYEVRVRSAYGNNYFSEWVYSTVVIPNSDNNVPNITGLELFDQGNNTSFVGKHIKLRWNKVTPRSQDTATGPAAEATPMAWFRYYELKIYAGSILLRTEPVPVETYDYDYEKNYKDCLDKGLTSASRTISFELRAVATWGDSSAIAAKLTATNAASPVPANITGTSFIGGLMVSFDPLNIPDLLGYEIHASQSAGFTPTGHEAGSGTCINSGSESSFFQKQAVYGTWFIKVGSYDTFGTDGMVYSGDVTVMVATPASVMLEELKDKLGYGQFAPGVYPVRIVTSLPVLPDPLYPQGVSVSLTTDNQLYRSTGTEWIATIPAANVTGQLSDSQIADIAAAKMTGQIVSTQITDDAITTPKINARAITASKIAVNTITANEIAASTITATQIAALTITSAELATNSITSAKIVAGAITVGKLAAGAIIAGDAVIANAAISSAQIISLTADKILTGTMTASQSITVGGMVIDAGTSTNNGNIRLGKTSATDNTNSGFWLGNDGGVAKFKIGNAANTKYISWNGTDLNIRGTLNADDIASGTITGRTIQTADTGKRTAIYSAGYSDTDLAGELHIYDDTEKIASIGVNQSGSDTCIAIFGTETTSNTKRAVQALASSAIAIYAKNTSTSPLQPALMGNCTGIGGLGLLGRGDVGVEGIGYTDVGMTSSLGVRGFGGKFGGQFSCTPDTGYGNLYLPPVAYPNTYSSLAPAGSVGMYIANGGVALMVSKRTDADVWRYVENGIQAF